MQLDKLFTQVLYDGLAFFGNEPTTVCDGEAFHATLQCLVIKTPTANARSALLEASTDTKWYSSIGDQSEESTYKLPFIPGF